MRFSDALLLGLSSYPSCRGVFLGAEVNRQRSGCLITNAVRAAGREPQTGDHVITLALELWPWLETRVMPTRTQVGTPGLILCEGAPVLPTEDAPTLCWLIEHYDREIASPEWLIAQIRKLEDAIGAEATEQPAPEPVAELVPVGGAA